VPIIVAQCRAGFEPEAAADLARLAEAARCAIDVDFAPDWGYVLARSDDLDRDRWTRALAATPPIFIRSAIFCTGPHALTARATDARPDRVAPLVDAIAASASGTASDVWIEFPDTNDGKALSTLARALAPRVERALRERGMIEPNAPNRVRVFLPDGNAAFVGFGNRRSDGDWPMGIPRLRMPYGAPSRSTLKLVEAFMTFLGHDEGKLVRAGMRAVDLGAAPGGWTWQLAQRGLKVTAVDNGALKGDVAIDPRVTHIRADGLAWRPRTPVDWLVCDIVLQPIRIAALVADWIADGAAQRAVFNLKLPMKRRYDEVQRCEALIGERLAQARGGFDLRFRHLYHDREEVTGYLARRA
jgi:23S rRNA (cytidine2498-2'-O)-methyltransferase